MSLWATEFRVFARYARLGIFFNDQPQFQRGEFISMNHLCFNTTRTLHDPISNCWLQGIASTVTQTNFPVETYRTSFSVKPTSYPSSGRVPRAKQESRQPCRSTRFGAKLMQFKPDNSLNLNNLVRHKGANQKV